MHSKNKLGTTIYINPNDLETLDGKPLTENIEIELKELTNQLELFGTNTQTVSNGKLLVSGGAYYLNMKSNGKQLKIKDGKNINIDFPKLTNEKMSLFYGQKDSLGIMNWESTKTKFTNIDKIKENKNSNSDSLSVLTDEFDD